MIIFTCDNCGKSYEAYLDTIRQGLFHYTGKLDALGLRETSIRIEKSSDPCKVCALSAQAAYDNRLIQIKNAK